MTLIISPTVHFLSNKLDIRKYDAEIITQRGAIFGTLILNTDNITFKSCPREESSKYKYGSPTSSQIVRDVWKQWKFNRFKEVLVKRYNLIRQAVEIYFDDNSSVFVSLFSKEKLLVFLQDLKAILLKKGIRHLKFITRPEDHFTAKNFKEQWIENKLTNFEYLMLLNKYGGRSFNDLHQYPVFPWIISNYQGDTMDLHNISNYRDLRLTIGGISDSKRESVDAKLEMMLGVSDLEPYQIATHFLPARFVLGYLFRIEPFSSLLLQFEKKRDSPARMFHSIGLSWHTGTLDMNDNKELVPEFFYLADMFCNGLGYSYGKKFPDNGCMKYVNNIKAKVRVDQVILPDWAKSTHDFIMKNAIALENISLKLNEWIGIIFGNKQQDIKSYNLYKNLCDEKYVNDNIEEITESNIAEIGEFGSNPIKLFTRDHPNRRAIENEVGGLMKIGNVETSIRDIQVCLNEVYVICDNQRYICADKKALKKGIKNKLRKLPTNKNLIYDTKRMYTVINRKLIIRNCFDCTCRAIDTSFQDTIGTPISLHEEMISVVLGEGHTLFTGSIDGVLEKRTVKEVSTLDWFAGDFSEPIIALDYNKKLDLVIAGTSNGLIIARTASSGKYLCSINSLEDGELKLMRLSFRGYIIAAFSCLNKTSAVLTMTINGELVSKVYMEETINTLIIDKIGYNIIIAHSKLILYNFISLESKDLLKEELADITALELLSHNTLLIATNTGIIYQLKYNP